jgi:cation/acetate symporter
VIKETLMSSAIYEQIRKNPKFQQLVSTRSRFAWMLAFTVLTIFYGFILVVAFNPAVMGLRMSEGSMITVGAVTIFSMFVFFWILTALYVQRANTEFDSLTQEIIREAARGTKK